MSTFSTKTERIHALDSLRAIMMMLGIVLHTALFYGTESWWLLKDPSSNNHFFDWLFGVLHVFRMPAFFIVAGFFGALLFYERTVRKMIKNRIERILLPFLVFLFILWPLIAFSWTYTMAAFSGNENALSPALKIFSNFRLYIPPSTFHLWFLYYLLIITFAATVLGLLFKKLPALSAKIEGVFSTVIQKPLLRLLIFPVFSFLIFIFLKENWTASSNSFIPDFKSLVFYLQFYLFGWVLYKSRKHLNEFMRFDWLSAASGIILFTVGYILYSYLSPVIFQGISVLSGWLLIFGVTGLFLRYGSQHSLLMRYISDSSYWVYLIHLPLTAFLPGLIAQWYIPAFAKFLFVILITLLICGLSYHYLVRNTFIGKFINGRRYSREFITFKPMEELQKVA